MEFDENLNPIAPGDEPDWSRLTPGNLHNAQPASFITPNDDLPISPHPITTPPPAFIPATAINHQPPFTPHPRNHPATNPIFMLSLILMGVITLATITFSQPFFQNNSIRELTAIGVGEAYITPDVAKINFAVRTENKNISESQRINSEVIAKIKNELVKFTISPEDVKTIQYNINPEYDYYSVSKPRLRGYSTYHSIMLVVRDLTATDAIVQALGSAGATEISQVNFTTDDPSEVQNEAREKAIQAAQAKAEQLASLSNAKLGKISSIIETSPQTDTSFSNAPDGMGGGGGGLEFGSNKVTSTVTITYTLK